MGKIFSFHPDRFWGPPNHLYNGYRVISKAKPTRGWITTYTIYRQAIDLPLLHIWAFLFCSGVNFTLTLLTLRLCDELITRPEESYRLCCVVVCDLETSRMGAPYIYDISRLRVNPFKTGMKKRRERRIRSRRKENSKSH